MITRDWMQIGLCIFISGMLGFLVINNGDKEMTMFFAGLFGAKIIDFAFKIKSSAKKDV